MSLDLAPKALRLVAFRNRQIIGDRKVFFVVTKLWPSRYLGCNSKNRRQTFLNVFARGRPGRHADSHGNMSLPFGFAAPTGPLRLDTPDNPASLFFIAEFNQNLIQHNII